MPMFWGLWYQLAKIMELAKFIRDTSYRYLALCWLNKHWQKACHSRTPSAQAHWQGSLQPWSWGLLWFSFHVSKYCILAMLTTAFMPKRQENSFSWSPSTAEEKKGLVDPTKPFCETLHQSETLRAVDITTSGCRPKKLKLDRAEMRSRLKLHTGEHL